MYVQEQEAKSSGGEEEEVSPTEQTGSCNKKSGQPGEFSEKYSVEGEREGGSSTRWEGEPSTRWEGEPSTWEKGEDKKTSSK